MKCPNCEHVMHDVDTESHGGFHVFLDQCGRCGGLWFDYNELHKTRHGAAKEIERVDTEKLNEIVPIKEKLKCPRDNKILKVFDDRHQYFPDSMQVERCSECGGFWLNRGEFSAFQDYREKVRSRHWLFERKKMEREEKEEKKELKQAVKDPEKMEEIGNFLGFSAGKKVASDKSAVEHINKALRVESGTDRRLFVLSVLRLLLKLFFRI